MLGAAFQQNSLERVKPGDEAEVAFDAVPGRVFNGKVRTVLDAIAAGQIQASGALVDFAERTEGGRAFAIIDLEDDISKYQIPVGAAGQVAIYTEHGTTSPYCARFSCACEVGKTISSSKDTDVLWLAHIHSWSDAIDNSLVPY